MNFTISSFDRPDQPKSSLVPLLQSPPDFVRRRPAAFQLKTMSGRAWDPDLLTGSSSTLGSKSGNWTNGDSNPK